MLNDLFIQLPKDFDERYEKYVADLTHEQPKVIEVPSKEPPQKQYDVKENLSIKNLNLEIKGGYVYKEKAKFKINPTDREIIDFLYQRHAQEKDACSSLEVIEKNIKKATGTIKNRIVEINKGIKKMVSGDRKTNIDEFIKNEPGRGYRLNPRFVIKITKVK